MTREEEASPQEEGQEEMHPRTEAEGTPIKEEVETEEMEETLPKEEGVKKPANPESVIIATKYEMNSHKISPCQRRMKKDLLLIPGAENHQEK